MSLLQKILGRADGSEPDRLMAGDDASSDFGEDAEGELAVDVYQTKDNIVVQSTIAGVKPEDLDITISDSQVTIQGERQREEEVRKEDYYSQECYWGAFYRSFELPVEVDSDKATADIKDGILTLVLPKLSKTRTKKLKVRQMAE